jgi:16S rRNA C967 or C1407 C5-methylase (RsmB/RsmF family)
MLAIGGKVVYSTCSMNPVEDEAVVSQLLLRAQGNQNWPQNWWIRDCVSVIANATLHIFYRFS